MYNPSKLVKKRVCKPHGTSRNTLKRESVAIQTKETSAKAMDKRLTLPLNRFTPSFAAGKVKTKANNISKIVQKGKALPKGWRKYAESITVYIAKTGFHSPLERKPAAKTLSGSAITPNIQKASGFIIRAVKLPTKAAKKPIFGPKIIPSRGSK